NLPPVSDEGVDLADLAAGDVANRTVYSQFQQGRYGEYMTTDSRWKYVYSAPDDREWLFDRVADPRETRNLARNPMYVAPLAELRRRSIERFQRDGYAMAVDGEDWRRYPPSQLPVERDFGLLFQDAANLEERIAALGEYARPVAVRGPVAEEVLVPEG
ncbi:MAG: hypothetical protein HC802_23615, partial [Caldilineaceae bacterium]|nr:hypothetical protein [Caldilineaceae bacterium]